MSTFRYFRTATCHRHIGRASEGEKIPHLSLFCMSSNYIAFLFPKYQQRYFGKINLVGLECAYVVTEWTNDPTGGIIPGLHLSH